METALGLLAVLALILANGYFVAGEFAFVATRRSKLEELGERGNRRAARALQVLKRLSFVLSGAQLGITVTSLVLGFIAEGTLGAAFAPLLRLVGVPEQAAGAVALTLGLIVATASQMVLGELAPKNLAIARPEGFALALAPSTWLYIRLGGPIIRLFDDASNRLLRAVGIEPVEELNAGVSTEELEYIIEHSGREGALTPEQTDLLSRALLFQNLRAGNAMVPRTQLVVLPSDATCDDLRRVAAASGHSRFPVVGEDLDDVRGVVQAKDVLAVPPPARPSTAVRTLAEPPFIVPESALLGPLLGDMRVRHTSLAVVVDEYGGTAGIVTIEDIVEELVGSIRDEHDEREPTPRPGPDGSLVVPGTWRIDEAERAAGLRLPAGDYDTLGGLIMERLGRVPAAGDRVELDSAGLCVEAMEGHAVAEVRVEPKEPAHERPNPGTQVP